MKRRITFRGVEDAMGALERLIYQDAFNEQSDPENIQEELLIHLQAIKQTILKDHDGLVFKFG
jgi:phosphoenolpyruvate carboxylase